MPFWLVFAPVSFPPARVATAEANMVCYGDRGRVKLEKHRAHIFSSKPQFGIQTSVLDFCQPVLTLATLAFPSLVVQPPAPDNTPYKKD